MNRIDLSKLPPPQLIEELDYEDILAEMRERMRALCPDWTGHELESDPANKVLEVCAYRELLLRQRVNEAARSVMVAFAAGSDLDHLAAFYPETRLAGAAATFIAELRLSQALDVEVTVPSGFAVVARNGAYRATLVDDVIFAPGVEIQSGVFEITLPAGMEGNGLQPAWDAITPLPFVVKVEQSAPSAGGSDAESDAAFRLRIPQALERFSTCGAFGAYRYWAQSADPRIADVSVWTPERGVVAIAVLSAEGDGTADEAMLRRVEEVLRAEDRRPGTDLVQVQSAEIVSYAVRMTVEIYPGVAGDPPYEEARRRVEAKVRELCGLGLDVTRSALAAAAHVEGVKRVDLAEPAQDIRIERHQAARCTSIEVGSRVADER